MRSGVQVLDWTAVVGELFTCELKFLREGKELQGYLDEANPTKMRTRTERRKQVMREKEVAGSGTDRDSGHVSSTVCS